MQSNIRTLASDTLVYGVSTMAGRFLTFLLTPLYTNFLTASQIGDVTAIYAVIAFVNIVYSLGLEPAFMRFWERDDEHRSKQVFQTAFIGVAFTAIVVTLATIAFAAPIAASPFLMLETDGARLVAVASLIPFFDSLALLSFSRLRMQRRPKMFAYLRLLTIVVNVTLNVVFVVVLHWQIMGVVLAGVISSLISFVVFIPSIRFERMVGGFRLLAQMLKFGLPTIPASFSSIVVLMADRTVMLMLTNSSTLGLYQTNFRLAIPMLMFVSIFETAWKPFYLNNRNEADIKPLMVRVLTMFTIVSGVIFLTTSLFMPYVVRMPFIGGNFINPTYWVGLGIVPIIMLAYYFNGVFVNLSAGLHITMRTGWFPVAMGVAAVANVVVMLLLVPSMGINGAAWAKVAAYAASMVLLFVFVRRAYPVMYDGKRISLVVLITGGIYALCMQVPVLTTEGLIVRIAAIPVFVAVLFATGILQRSVITSLISMVRR